MFSRSPISVSLISILLACLSGCSTMIDGMPPGPAHEAYEPLDDPAAETFFFECLEKAEAAFGEPSIPVKKIHFRRSRKTEAAKRYRIAENFSLTQCIDSTNGVFVVYIGVDPGQQNYYPLLGHESAHLINAHIMDWYMEGLATLFSEEMCKAADKSWGDWGRHFRRSRKDPYGRSYRLMRDLQLACPDEYAAIVQHVEPNARNPEWLQIDIDGWLDTLNDEQYAAALDIIEPHLKVLKKHARVYYTIKIPAALKEGD